MRTQHEKNKEILMEEIEKYCGQPMNNAIAERLSVYYGALNAICLAEANWNEPSVIMSEDKHARHRMTSETAYRAKEQSTRPVASSGYMPLTRDAAMLWVSDMENSDGTHGPHWSVEQVEQVMEQRGIKCDPVQFYAVLNAVYSDYCSVAKKFGVNKMDFYSDLAKAWLEDDDAVEDKAGKYFMYIVKH